MGLDTTRDDRATVLITVAGSMTIYEAAQYKDRLLAALADATALELDLGGVDEADTAGLQLLLLARREAGRAGRPLRIRSLGPALGDAVARYGLQAVFAAAPPRLAGPEPMPATAKEMP